MKYRNGILRSTNRRPAQFAARFAALMSFVALTAACSPNSSTGAGSETGADAQAAESAAQAEALDEKMAQDSKNTVSKKSASRKMASKEKAYIVQVGTFKVESNAKKMMDQLRAKGLPVTQKKIDRANGEVFYAVRFEPTPSRAEAEKFASTVQATFGSVPMIFSAGQ